MPSESSLFFNRLSARSTGSPLRTSTSGIDNQLLTCKFCAQMATPSLIGQADFVKSAAYRASGLAAVGFWVISLRKVLVLSPRARVHQSTIGEAMKIDE